jgi:hypothetical protein
LCFRLSTIILVRFPSSCSVSFPRSCWTWIPSLHVRQFFQTNLILVENPNELNSMSICSNERISRNLDVVYECIQALHLAVRPPRDAELPAPLL